jgi:hypothetical protein
LEIVQLILKVLAGVLVLASTACGSGPYASSSSGETNFSAENLDYRKCRAEARNAWWLFTSSDRNNDRRITLTEARATSFAKRYNFWDLDHNKDGAVSHEEFGVYVDWMYCEEEVPVPLQGGERN